MPLFDYKCKKCGFEDEYLVRDYMVEMQCPKCHSPMEKQISYSNFRLYGEGFYKQNKK